MLVYVPLSQIDDNPYQSRTEYGDIAGLAADIAARMDTYPETRGLMQVPRGRLVNPDGKPVGSISPMAQTVSNDGRWRFGDDWRVQLAFGHRRKRAFDHLAANDLGTLRADLMPVYIEALSDAEMLDAVWSENYQRTDISAVEQAELLQRKLDQVKATGGNQTTVAEAWGLARPTIANRLRLLELPAEVQQANREGKLSERQCLALSTVARIGSMVNGQPVKWGNTYVNSWGEPVSPTRYIEHVIEQGDKVSSDQIRDYQQKLLSYLGQTLPDIIATTSVEDPAVVQVTCKGCKARVNQHCLNAACLATKQAAVAVILAKQAADELNLPYSDDDTHFTFGRDYEQADQLKTLWEAGISENLVIGWQRERYAARPFIHHNYVSGSPFHREDSGYVGIAIGHKLGHITADEQRRAAEADPEQAAEAGPDRETREAWKQRTKKITSARKKRVTDAIARAAEPLAENPDWLRPLLALAEPRWMQADDATPDKYLKKLLSWIQGKAYYIGDTREAQRQLLIDAGLSPELVDPPDRHLRLEELAIDALSDWYEHRDWEYHRTGAIGKLNAACVAFEEARSFVSQSLELTTLAVQLAEAEEDVKRLTAAKEEA